MKITVAFNTFRLGSFDAVVTSLERQQGIGFDEFELVIADELHRWREPTLRDRLARCPFKVKHLPVERSLFPVASTMRAGNTVLRNAEGELIVHVCDGAVVPPEFLAAHWGVYQRFGGTKIGVMPYRVRPVSESKRRFVPALPFWDHVERAMLGNQYDHWTYLLSADRAPTAPEPPNPEEFSAPFDSSVLGAGSPALDCRPDQPANEWFVHYKVDSIPLAAYKAVDGWDEEYDGGYVYADIDMTMRLQAFGLETWIVNCTPVDILDAHCMFVRKPEVSFREADAPKLLDATRKRLLADKKDFLARRGLSLARDPRVPGGGAVLDFGAVPWPTSSLVQGSKPTKVTLMRSWLPDGRLDTVVPSEYALAWQHLVPPVLCLNEDGFDAGRFKAVLGARGVVRPHKEGPKPDDPTFGTVIVVGEDPPLQVHHYEALFGLAAVRFIVISNNRMVISAAEEACSTFKHVPAFWDADDAIPVNGLLAYKDAR